MARTESSDPLSNFRFHVTAIDPDGALPLLHSDTERGEAGFQSCTLPELSAESVEYREGHMTFTEKYSGVPQVSDISLMRGVTKTDSKFFDWMWKAVTGGEYRADLVIYQWHRDGKTHGSIADVSKARKYNCYNGFPTRCKPSADLDATSGDVSIAELDIAIEYFEIEAAS